ncbi:MAG: hypothetical protein JSV56_12205 [Methanomassiliicoccales archaeon]|nr:MAG: hypothetical protein JSV56_12205 [Methanomassiliicoccales archaeon]
MGGRFSRTLTPVLCAGGREAPPHQGNEGGKRIWITVEDPLHKDHLPIDILKEDMRVEIEDHKAECMMVEGRRTEDIQTDREPDIPKTIDIIKECREGSDPRKEVPEKEVWRIEMAVSRQEEKDLPIMMKGEKTNTLEEWPGKDLAQDMVMKRKEDLMGEQREDL